MTTQRRLTDADVSEARRLWERHQREHDLGDRDGQAVGIDPETGEVWSGDSMIDIVEQRRAADLDSPLVFGRIGRRGYQQKLARTRLSARIHRRRRQSCRT